MSHDTTTQLVDPYTTLERFLSRPRLIERVRGYNRPRKRFTDSVDETCPVVIDHVANPIWKRDQLCWEPKGPCAELYQNIEPELLNFLNCWCQESSHEVAIALFMVGKSPAKAKPIIIIASEHKYSRDDAKKTILARGILDDTDFELGVMKYLPSGPINPLAGGYKENTRETHLPGCTWLYKDHIYFNAVDPAAWVALQVYVPQTSGRPGEVSLRKATANAVHITRKTGATSFGYITTAHVLDALRTESSESLPKGEHKTELFESFDEDADDSDLYVPFATDNEDEEDEDMQIRFINLNDNTTSNESPHSTSPNSWSSADGKSANGGYLRLQPSGLIVDQFPDVDCILFQTMFDANETLQLSSLEGESQFRAYKMAVLQCEDVHVMTPDKTIPGQMLPSPFTMRLSGSSSYITMWKVKCSEQLRRGDSGSIIIDTEGKKVYGIVVAASPDLSLAYAVPASSIFERLSLGGVDIRLCIPPLHQILDRKRLSQLNPAIIAATIEWYHRAQRSSADQDPLRKLSPRTIVALRRWHHRAQGALKGLKKPKQEDSDGSTSWWIEKSTNEIQTHVPMKRPSSLSPSPSPFTQSRLSQRPLIERPVNIMAFVRNHTTDQLGPDGDEYLPGEADPKGEAKISSDGHVLGGRVYKCRTFHLPNRGQKLFMLETECVRVLGYADSYILSLEDRSLDKIVASQADKDWLIRQGILPYSYRSRQIVFVTARSMFRRFGSRLIVGGRRVIDDYWEAKARRRGFTEEDMAGDNRTGGRESCWS